MRRIDEHSYDDMLRMEHHISANHKRMPVSKRAAQFLPFAALEGYEQALKKQQSQKEEKHDVLTEEDRDELDDKIRLLFHRAKDCPEVSVILQDGEGRKTVCGKVEKMDAYRQRMILADGRIIPFAQLIQIEGRIFDDEGEEK